MSLLYPNLAVLDVCPQLVWVDMWVIQILVSFRAESKHTECLQVSFLAMQPSLCMSGSPR